MEMHETSNEGQLITAIGEDWIEIGGEKITGPVIVGNSYRKKLEGVTKDTFDVNHDCIKTLLEEGLELVLYGAGAKFAFAKSEISELFLAKHIGFEAMDTPSACRTFNVLIAEDRNVATILFHG